MLRFLKRDVLRSFGIQSRIQIPAAINRLSTVGAWDHGLSYGFSHYGGVNNLVKRTFTTSSRGRISIETPGGTDGAGASIPLPGSIADRLLKTEADVAVALKLNERTNSEVKWVLAFGVGTVLLGIGSAVFKVYHYDTGREKDMKEYVKETEKDMKEYVKETEKDMKEYVKETVANSERVILAEMRGMEARLESRARWW